MMLEYDSSDSGYCLFLLNGLTCIFCVGDYKDDYRRSFNFETDEYNARVLVQTLKNIGFKEVYNCPKFGENFNCPVTEEMIEKKD